MSTLKRRVEVLERSYRDGVRDPCPEHRPSLLPADGETGAALRAALRAFSPDADERAAHQAEQEKLASTPPCPRCGWSPFVVFARPALSWAPAGLDDGDAA